LRDELCELLRSLESELRAQDRWSSRRPPERALQSRLPFAADTLDFDQWLQWILVPRLYDLLARQLPLPTACAIRPMAEEVYDPDDFGALRIVGLLGRIDLLLTAQQRRLN
jgi:uncharacterized protein YqcC (DUF446 family)